MLRNDQTRWMTWGHNYGSFVLSNPRLPSFIWLIIVIFLFVCFSKLWWKAWGMTLLQEVGTTGRSDRPTSPGCFLSFIINIYVKSQYLFNFFPPFSLGIIYGVFSFSNLLAPTVVTVIGPKITMFLSGLLYRYSHCNHIKYNIHTCC